MLNEDALDVFQRSHKQVTGGPFKHFRCPITLRDEAVELQRGHILNQALKTAARWQVPQRKDVDNHYGSTIEPDLIKWLNADSLSLKEIVASGRKFTVELPDGETCEAIPIKAKGVANKFPKISVCDDDGVRPSRSRVSFA